MHCGTRLLLPRCHSRQARLPSGEKAKGLLELSPGWKSKAVSPRTLRVAGVPPTIDFAQTIIHNTINGGHLLVLSLAKVAYCTPIRREAEI